MKTFLHVGCGSATKASCIPFFRAVEWREVRLDIDPKVNPDIVGTMTTMPAVESNLIDAVYSCHNLEHLYAHEVEPALKEFLRVLTPAGFAVVTCPDLQAVAKLVAEDRLLDTAFVSPAGPIAPLDMLYGYRPALAAGNQFMGHRCGFTLKTLLAGLTAAGFKSVGGFTDAKAMALWAVARKDFLTAERMREFIASIFS